jgi:hypothetical protein
MSQYKGALEFIFNVQDHAKKRKAAMTSGPAVSCKQIHVGSSQYQISNQTGHDTPLFKALLINGV